MKNSTILPTGLGLLLAVLAVGCNRAPSPTPASPTPASPTPSATAGGGADTAGLPQGWKRVAGQDVPQATAATPRLPARVRSDDGAEVEVRDVGRIVAGGDDVIAVLEALGLADNLYAAPERSATAAGKAAEKHFLFNRTTGVEGVLSLDGSLFLGNSLRRHGVLAERLRATGHAAVVIDDLQPPPDKVRKVAEAVGLPVQGQALAMQVQAQMDQAAAMAAHNPRRPRVIALSASGAGGLPTVAGADSAANQLITLAGGINIGEEAGVANYSQLSNEGVVAAAPEVILVTDNDLRLFGGEAGLWKAYPTLRHTPAGAANRVWVMPDIALKATSVGSGAGALALAQALAELARG
ncbi:ABC transporter substrate-binding protein [Stenotrophomonas sp. STM01]|uniref:heme/hemin ABC transporter substrate-binding protein n=1 Tax=Stenotrophomonas sp. STM01 TaxID=2769278 RepID=UPI0017854F6F|nr:ABC transporter substrate-binding protein [Stenotrophomonas sp. STM01]MBD9536769.1 ABC transporter substrate-binding protein [Stenotrophomonas sp. STM01]